MIAGLPWHRKNAHTWKRNGHAIFPICKTQGCGQSKNWDHGPCDCDTVTPLIEGKECAYAFFQDRNCLCAIEKAHIGGVSSFRKPVSCWLYPIRVQKLADGAIGLNYHKWYLCSAARELGAKKKIRVFEFVKEPLIHCFGPDVYQAIRQAADNPG